MFEGILFRWPKGQPIETTPFGSRSPQFQDTPGMRGEQMTHTHTHCSPIIIRSFGDPTDIPIPIVKALIWVVCASTHAVGSGDVGQPPFLSSSQPSFAWAFLLETSHRPKGPAWALELCLGTKETLLQKTSCASGEGVCVCVHFEGVYYRETKGQTSILQVSPGDPLAERKTVL